MLQAEFDFSSILQLYYAQLSEEGESKGDQKECTCVQAACVTSIHSILYTMRRASCNYGKQEHMQEYLSWYLSTMHYAAMSDEYTYYLPLAVFALFRLQHLMGAYTVVIIVIIAAIAPGTASAIVIILSVLSPLIPASGYVQNVKMSIDLELPPLYPHHLHIHCKKSNGKYVL